MALPEVKTLDLAWLGSGPFCRAEPKSLSTGGLDFAWLGSGPFWAEYLSGVDALAATALPVPVDFVAAVLEADLAATPLGVPIDFGAGTLADQFAGTPFGVPVDFGAAGLEAGLAATPLGVPVDFAASVLNEVGSLVATALDVPVAFGSAAFESHFLGTPLDVPAAFGAASLADSLAASPLDVPLAFSSAVLVVGLTSAALDVPVAFGAALLFYGNFTATPLDVPVAFDHVSLTEPWRDLWASELDIWVDFETAALVADQEWSAEPLAVSIRFGGAQLRVIRTGEFTGPPLALVEPLELLDATGVLIRNLPLARDVRIRQKINSLDVLTLDYPRDDAGFDDFAEGCLVRWRGQSYRVVDVDDERGFGGVSGTVTAEQWFIALGDTLIKSVLIDGLTAEAAMAVALAGTGWTVGAVGPAGTYSIEDRWKSPLAVLMAIADVWNGELVFDTAALSVSLLTERGVDLGASLIYRKNVVGLTRKRSAASLYNRVYYEGKDGLTSLGGYVEDAASIAAHGRRDYYWGDSTITTLSTLVYGATLRLNAYKEPRIDYDASAFNFEPLAGGSSWVTAELGDRVRVYDEELGINVATRVYEREWAPFEPSEPDRLKLSSDREWFPDLSEKLAEVLEPEVPEPKDKPTPGEDACKGEGGYSWMNAQGVPPEWQGSGRPHIWTSYWSDGAAGLPHLGSDGKWHSGYDTDKDGTQDSGPLGTGATWEAASWEPHGFDLDCDGIEDFWPFSSGVDPTTRTPMFGQPGGHCYNFDDTPEVWDYAGGDMPYKAVDTIPAALWYDITAYTWWGYDNNGNGVPDTWDVIANMPCPISFKRPQVVRVLAGEEPDHPDSYPGALLLGFDLGGGNVRWDFADPPIIPMWHSKASVKVQGIYCTGWTPDGQRNMGGPVKQLDGSWTPQPYDTNDDGFSDFWAYGGWWSFGCQITEEGASDQAVAVAACGATAPTGGVVTPPVDGPNYDCFECDVDGYLRILSGGLRLHTTGTDADLVQVDQVEDFGLKVTSSRSADAVNTLWILPSDPTRGIGVGGGATFGFGEYPLGVGAAMTWDGSSLLIDAAGARAAAAPVIINSYQDAGYVGNGLAELNLWGAHGAGGNDAYAYLLAESADGSQSQVTCQVAGGASTVRVYGDEILIGPNFGGSVYLRVSGGRLQANVGGTWKNLLVTGE